MSWASKTKDDLIIEVWEKLDCENVGGSEIEAIETAVGAEFGGAAVDSPMLIARLLADEGAELRHSEIMELYVERASYRPYQAAVENLIRLDDLQTSLSSIREVENLRRKYASSGDREGSRHLRETVLAAKTSLKKKIESPTADPRQRRINIEIFEWLSHWLQTPDLFLSWVGLRLENKDFIATFGQLRK